MKKIMLLVILTLAINVQDVSADKWSSIESEHFIVRFTRSKVAAHNIQAIAEGFYPRVTIDLGYTPKRKITIWFYGSHKEFKRAFSAPIQDWAAGFAYPLSARVVIRDPVSLSNKKLNLSRLLKHEITHVIFGLYVGQNLRHVPRWFNEGLAMYEAEEWTYGHYWTILTGALGNSLIPLYELAENFPQSEARARLAYAQSCSIVTFMVKKYGSDSLRECIRLIAEGRGIDEAMAGAVGIDVGWLERKWLRELKKSYKWISIITSWVVLWTIVILIGLIGYWRRKVRNRRILEQWEEEEAWWGFDEGEDSKPESGPANL
jgi:hypothetical protein